MHEFEKSGEKCAVVQGVAGDVAENTDVALFLREAAHDLHRTGQQENVDNGHQAGRRSELDVLRRHDHRSVFSAQSRQRLVETQCALRQADDRLQIEIDAAVFQRVADGLEQFGLWRLKTGFRRTSAQNGRSGAFDRRTAFRAFGSEVVHQALECLKLVYDLAVLRERAGLDHLVGVIDSGVKFLQRHLQTPLQAGDFTICDSARPAMTSIGVYLETAKREHDARKKTRRCARKQVHRNTHGGAEEQVGRSNQEPRHHSIRSIRKRSSPIRYFQFLNQIESGRAAFAMVNERQMLSLRMIATHSLCRRLDYFARSRMMARAANVASTSNGSSPSQTLAIHSANSSRSASIWSSGGRGSNRSQKPWMKASEGRPRPRSPSSNA